jgi:hypothetical protein
MLIWADVSWLPPSPDLSLPVRILAALGITAAGGLGAGLIVQLLSKGVARTKAPGPAVNLVRLAGAGAGGLFAILWLFGTGSGFGTGKGDGDGDGKPGKQGIYSSTTDDKKNDTDDKKKPGPETPAGEEVLRVEVLGNAMVRKLADQKAVDENRRYRIAAESQSKLLTLDEVVDYIAKRPHTPDRLQVVSYKTDTRPQDKAAALERFAELARDLGKDKVKGGWVETDDLGKLPPL